MNDIVKGGTYNQIKELIVRINIPIYFDNIEKYKITEKIILKKKKILLKILNQS